MTSRLRIPLIALATLLMAGASSLDARTAPSERPLILVVHGRGYVDRDSADFRRQSLRALRQGAFVTTKDSLLADDDVRIVWYADLLDRRQRGSRTVEACRANEGPTSIVQMFALLASELIESNEAAASGAGDDARGIAGDLRFFGDAATRCAAERRIGDAVARAHSEGRPVILVGHSLGAMVAWGHLSRRATASGGQLAEVRRFVTIGSPLGSRGLRELLLGDSASVSLPKSVRSWVNVVNGNDPFAAKLTGLDSATGRMRSLPGITDVLVDRSDDDAHEYRAYLRNPATTKAVLGAWCDALDDRSKRAACAALKN